MKKIIYILCTALLTGACAKFLDVNPKGEVFDGDMFTSAEGVEDALYGVYSELANTESLWGAYLHWIPEACSQNVLCPGDYKMGNMASADWKTSGPVSVRKDVWNHAYEAINHINNIIAHCEDEEVKGLKHYGLYKGEALALRALVHFELVNLFAVPDWADASEKARAIPYVKNYSFDITPYSSLDGVYAAILEDLTEAERLLAEDRELIPETRTNSSAGFTDARITHMNLYAVKALLARLYWTRGQMEDAARYAHEVIDSQKFGFRPRAAFVQPDNGTLDLRETIFGFYTRPGNSSYQSFNCNKYRLSGTSSTSSFTLASDWQSLYEGVSASQNDYRLAAWFSAGDETLTKLVNQIFYTDRSASYSGSSILGCNVFRIPEMYYIMAEYYLDQDNAEAVKYYDAVVTTRGGDSLEEEGRSLTYDMLFRERRREFYGEGFTWHEMRRRKMDITTFSGTVLPGSLTSTYTVPIPDEEDETRKNTGK